MMLPHVAFRSRLAGRLFLYFLLGAFFPILLFGYLTDWQMGLQMRETHEQYLFRTAGMFNQFYLNRLMQLEDALRMLRGGGEWAGNSDTSPRRFFLSVERGSLAGSGLSEEERMHLAAGHPLLTVRPDGRGQMTLHLLLADSAGGNYLDAVPKTEALWGISEQLPLPSDTTLHVLTPDGQPLFSSFDAVISWPESALRTVLAQSHGLVELNGSESAMRCYFRELFLKGHFLYPRWTLVLVQDADKAQASRTSFMTLFPLLVTLCLSMVLYMILVAIRRSLTPLATLRSMARRVAEQDFEARVEISSGDEVEELGHAFNSMAVQLKQQFRALGTQAAIDREILSALDVDTVVTTALDYFSSTFGASFTALFLWDKDVFRVFLHEREGEFQVFTVGMDMRYRDRLWGRLLNAGWIDAADIPELGRLVEQRTDSGGLVCSVPRHGPPMGMLCLSGMAPVDVAHLDLAGRTLNQIAVAFTNIRLVRELNEFNWGTIEALARAVDEKSSWTQGHSNRVAALAMELAEHMGWSESELEVMHRAALLHDLGKIGIPSEVLDKPSRLTEEEFALIQTHPDRGAKILEPVPAYAEIIPMVRHHHERFDGSGYPGRLSGQDIPLGARILAVADVYDAVSVTRPYRKAWSHAESCDFLLKNAGTQFDPDVVAAFMELWCGEEPAQ